MMKMQRLGLQTMRLYQPFAMAALNATTQAERTVLPTVPPSFKTVTGETAVESEKEQVVALGEEDLNVGTRIVRGKTTRVRRVVVETPVQQDVTLHTETVMVERRKPLSSSGENLLTEVTVELSDFNEVPVVTKDVRVVEEVLLRREVTARTETIRDTVKRDTIEVEAPSHLPVVFTARSEDRAHDEKAQDDRKSDNGQNRKSPPAAPHSARK